MLRLKKFIAEYTGNEKDRQVIKNMLAAFLIKGGALVISIFTMPAYMRYFNDQTVLGVWFTVVSVMSWILSFDLGIGNGLRNKLVGSIVRGDKQEIKAYVTSAYTVVAGISLAASSVGYAVSGFVNWNAVFSISKEIIPEQTMRFAVLCVFFSVMLQFLLRLITSVLYAMQKSAVTNLLSLITSASTLAFILLAPSYDAKTNLIMLSAANMIFANGPLIVASLIVFRTSLKNCAPDIRTFDRRKAADVLLLGGVFFWNQIMYMIITATNEYFITQYTKPGDVVEYQIYNKLFTLIGSLFMLALTPMWSEVTKAIHEKDIRWLKKERKLLNHLVVCSCCCEFLLVPFLQIIVNIWLGKSAIAVNFGYAAIFALYGSIFIYHNVLSTIVCGMGKMKLQAICYTSAVALKFLIVYFAMKIYSSWIVVVMANIIILIPYCILQPRYINRDIDNLKPAIPSDG